MKAKSFTCCVCGVAHQVAGGTAGFVCAQCKPASHFTLQPKYLAHKAVAQARRAGLIASPRQYQCADCTSPATEYDHRDYSKPLAVEPVCRGCNVRRGPANGHAVRRSQPATSNACGA